MNEPGGRESTATQLMIAAMRQDIPEAEQRRLFAEALRVAAEEDRKLNEQLDTMQRNWKEQDRASRKWFGKMYALIAGLIVFAFVVLVFFRGGPVKGMP
jgi:hypothetical protein